ncbi:PIG-L deacetylase family protein [Vallitalea guaymasensis]|uniref:PIG-L family deacetylase n=1 Tax=Vallitalea guaymasensis TaxID=1185412 RepID=A0A8J8MD13_9FIRM|nr:PIG-L deacetylase family protein [Vallitalea guaymasensis]QUH30666.1 PIG-L family deacetylase [Vallitalea guaymasensis]
MVASTIFKIPSIEDAGRILFVQPHPDDNDIGAGGTIAKLSNNGCEIYYLTVTNGSMGTVDPLMKRDKLAYIRKEEQEKAADILGVKQVISLGIDELTNISVTDMAGKIVSVIREIKPEIVITVDPWLMYEGHPDHIKVGKATVEACLFALFPHYPSNEEGITYESYSVQGIGFYHTTYPNTIIDIGGYFETKIKSIATHISQFNKDDLQMMKDYLKLKSKQIGESNGYKLAEGFKIFTPKHMHCFVDAVKI